MINILFANSVRSTYVNIGERQVVRDGQHSGELALSVRPAFLKVNCCSIFFFLPFPFFKKKIK